MSYPNVVADHKLLNPGYQIQVANANVVIDPTIPRVDYAHPDSYAFANLVTKKKTV
jgi:hypothetical protein